MGGSKSPSNTTTTVQNEPPSYVKPYVIDYMNQSADLATQPYQPYTGDLLAGFTPQNIYGMDYAQQVAMGGTPYADASMMAGMNTMANPIYNKDVGFGGINPYSGQNPYLENMISSASQGVTDNYMNSTAPQLRSMEMQQGAFGNTGLQQMQQQALSDLTSNLGDIQNQFRFQDYQTQQQLAESLAQRRMQADIQNANNFLNAQQIDQQGNLAAMGMAPQLEELRYLPSEQMMTIGDTIREWNQASLDDTYQRWMSEQMYPYQQLDLLANAIRTSMGGGGTSTTTAPNAYASNDFASLLGGGLSLYGLLNG